MLQRSEVGRRRGCRQSCVDHGFEPIKVVVAVVRRLEDENLTVFALERGYAQSHRGVAQQFIAERILQKGFQRFSFVLVQDVVPFSSPRGLDAAPSGVRRLRKDVGAARQVEVRYLRRR
jgi:hypothetical protein